MDQNTPTAPPGSPLNVADCACLNFRKMARAITQAYEANLRPLNLRATQFSLLAALGNLGGQSISALAEAMVMDPSTLSRNLRPLRKQGWVQMTRGEDARVHIVSLTPAGQAHLAEAMPAWEQSQRAFLAAFGETRMKSLMKELQDAQSLLPTLPTP